MLSYFTFMFLMPDGITQWDAVYLSKMMGTNFNIASVLALNCEESGTHKPCQPGPSAVYTEGHMCVCRTSDAQL